MKFWLDVAGCCWQAHRQEPSELASERSAAGDEDGSMFPAECHRSLCGQISLAKLTHDLRFCRTVGTCPA